MGWGKIEIKRKVLAPQPLYTSAPNLGLNLALDSDPVGSPDAGMNLSLGFDSDNQGLSLEEVEDEYGGGLTLEADSNFLR